MKMYLIIGGMAALLPYAWDSAAVSIFSSTSGSTQLATFSGALDVVDWEVTLAWIGGILLAIGVILALV